MASTLYRNGVVHSSSDPFAEALVVADGQVAWLGSEGTVHTVLDGVDEVVDLDGALVTPAFVDAHAHVLQTGVALDAVDLSSAAGVTSLATALDAVAQAATRARGLGATAPLVGHGWDESAWPEQRPPTREELDRATGGAPVHLQRTDVHSAVVSSSFARVAGCEDLPGWRDDGLLTGAAHHRALEVVAAVAREHRDRHEAAALRAAAAAGIASLHEQSTAELDDLAGLAALLDRTRDAASGLPLVVGYRAELCTTEDEARELLAAVPGLTGIGGDLCVDGSLGSRTAALRAPYADLSAGAADARGTLRLTAEDVAAHVVAVTRARSQAAFHVIGDRAMDEVVAGLRAAADQEGVAAVGAGRHRLEHAEMVDAPALAAMVLLGLVASVQPAFDARWGGADGMYARRLGAGRAEAMNPLADLAAAGVPLAFGSDAPVTPFDPWGAVLAAISHHDPGQRISARAAFRAHTRGGWRAAGLDHTGAGEIRLGAPASLAVWRAASLAVQAPDGRLAAWSTDPRAGTPLLPELGEGIARPVCLRTLRDGVVLHDVLG
ncbi:amidohydrolase family protein [Actinotalea ferrariae]|uniref:amidohydrolase n=1 Tax=Actinotalea ferrariae TaxID=1386098 RepID=UPI001C8CF1B7|nr:amidohydrolase family protein [Actinotalea ferrariae]MBX9245069.1 amidohydrolase family protein [Actinotalea ferrariae]